MIRVIVLAMCCLVFLGATNCESAEEATISYVQDGTEQSAILRVETVSTPNVDEYVPSTVPTAPLSQQELIDSGAEYLQSRCDKAKEILDEHWLYNEEVPKRHPDLERGESFTFHGDGNVGREWRLTTTAYPGVLPIGSAWCDYWIPHYAVSGGYVYRYEFKGMDYNENSFPPCCTIKATPTPDPNYTPPPPTSTPMPTQVPPDVLCSDLEIYRSHTAIYLFNGYANMHAFNHSTGSMESGTWVRYLTVFDECRQNWEFDISSFEVYPMRMWRPDSWSTILENPVQLANVGVTATIAQPGEWFLGINVSDREGLRLEELYHPVPGDEGMCKGTLPLWGKHRSTGEKGLLALEHVDISSRDVCERLGSDYYIFPPQ